MRLKHIGRYLNILKLTQIRTALMLLFVLLSFSVKAQQEQYLSLNLKNSTIEQLITQIEKNTNYKFILDPNEIDINSKITLKVDNETVNQILSKAFFKTNVKYTIENRQVILKKDDKTNSSNHKQQISGVVKDQNGDVLYGVTVYEENTNNGTTTNTDGAFNLSVTPKSKIVVTYLGFTTKKITVSSASKYQITMSEESKLIDEVVVVGYSSMKKSDINAAISSVKADALSMTSTPDFSSMLQGQAAGLTVTQTSAKPGGGISILVRGAGSVNAGNDPLYVIDGFPVNNTGVKPGSGTSFSSGSSSPLSDINPNDIESIEVLKDASATAIYGARGANGVILITTKRAKSGIKVEYSMNYGVSTIIEKPEVLNARDFMIEKNRYQKEQYLLKNKIYPYGDTNPSTIDPHIPEFSENQIANAGEGTNWFDEIIRLGMVNQHNVSIASGSDNSKSLVSMNFYDQNGLIKNSGYRRYTLRYNYDVNIRKWWSFGLSASGSYVIDKNTTLGDGRDDKAGIIESALNYSPLIRPERDMSTGRWVEDPQQALLNHPLSFLDMDDKTKTIRFLSSAFTNIHFIKDIFWLKLTAGVDVSKGQRKSYIPMTSKHGYKVGGDANINNEGMENYVTDAVLNFQKTFNSDHKLYAMAGYSYQFQTSDGVYSRATGFISDAMSYYRLQAGEKRPEVSSFLGEHKLASYFGRFQYSFQDKYLLTFTGRVDGSDRFGANNRYAFFPSAALAWRINQEEFAKNSEWLSNAKLRLSIGQVGNEAIPTDAALEYYSYDGRNYYFGDIQKIGMNLKKLGNPNLKWETTTETNLGFDFGFLQNRISGSVDVFYKEISDLLSTRRLPHNAVMSSVWDNIGTTQSKGAELTLNTINIKRPFTWTSTLTVTAYDDRWKERDPNVILKPYQRNNDALTSIFALIPDGIKQPSEDVPHMPTLLPGQMKYKDINGLDENGNLTGKPDGKINEADVVYVGNRAPKCTMGFTNVFKYKGFDLNVFLYASLGGYSNPRTYLEHGVYGSYGIQMISSNNNFLTNIKDRWNSDNMSATMPSGVANGADGYGAPIWYKSSYLRLKNVTLGYDFSRLFRMKNINLRAYASADNLFTATSYPGYDPETERDRASYPQQRTFSLGLNLNF